MDTQHVKEPRTKAAIKRAIIHDYDFKNSNSKQRKAIIHLLLLGDHRDYWLSKWVAETLAVKNASIKIIQAKSRNLGVREREEIKDLAREVALSINVTRILYRVREYLASLHIGLRGESKLGETNKIVRIVNRLKLEKLRARDSKTLEIMIGMFERILEEELKEGTIALEAVKKLTGKFDNFIETIKVQNEREDSVAASAEETEWIERGFDEFIEDAKRRVQA